MDGSSSDSGRSRVDFLAIAAPVFALFFGPLGIVVGVLARRRIRRTGEAGDQSARVGIAIGALVTASSLVAMVIVVVMR